MSAEQVSWMQACPVCYGRGHVQEGFYSTTTGSWTSNATGQERCRSCGATGLIVIPSYHQALLDTVAALEWYKTEAEAIKRNMERKNEGTTALTASMQVLALDGGKRAEAALARAREVVGV